MNMLNAVTSALTTVIGWVGTVVNALVKPVAEGTANGLLGELLPLLAIGVAISALMLGIKAIKSFIWGA